MIWTLLGQAWHAMGANKMRTFLTMLGMVIGVGAVVLMMAMGRGAEERVNQTIQSMGANLFIVLAGAVTSGGARMGSGGVHTLVIEDGEAIAELPGVLAAAPVYPRSAQVIHGNANWSTAVYGVTPDYLAVRSWEMASGSPFFDTEVRSATQVCLLGETVATNLFGGENPVGKTIRIRNAPYLVLGVLARKGQSLDGRDQDDTILVPITTAQRKLFGTRHPGVVRMIMVRATSAQTMGEVEREMGALLRQRHRVRDGEEDDFTIRNLSAVADAAAESTQALSTLLGAIASVSLLVGGIGIMNIMLVSVTERTREIGIRMAIGARERDVLSQFLLEALLVSVVGGMLGLALGVLIALGLERWGAIDVVITGSSALIAFGVAASVGVFFGYYPARKGARLDPIEALRYQ